MEPEKIYSFCPNCRSRLIKNQEGVPYCKRCNWSIYSFPVLGCNVIIENQEGKILMSERAFDPHSGSLDLPGGFVEKNESIEKSLQREVLEELNLKINLHDLTYFTSHPDRYEYKNINKHILTVTYTLKIDSRKIKMKSGDDSKSIFFYKLTEIPYKKIKFNCIKKAIHEYISRSSKQI